MSTIPLWNDESEMPHKRQKGYPALLKLLSNVDNKQSRQSPEEKGLLNIIYFSLSLAFDTHADTQPTRKRGEIISKGHRGKTS